VKLTLPLKRMESISLLLGTVHLKGVEGPDRLESKMSKLFSVTVMIGLGSGGFMWNGGCSNLGVSAI